jgi:three-Cys-motif partner protein
VTDPHEGKVVWEIEPHTVAKHKLLEKYLQAWYPILGSWNTGLNYVDGFAGPGEYVGGEDGSPVLALRTATDHKWPPKCGLQFFFIESDLPRADHLEALLGTRFPSLPPGWTYHVARNTFDDEVSGQLATIAARGGKLSPTFVFIDPFGFSQFPMSTLRAILANGHCEVFTTFMSSFVSRFVGEESLSGTLDALFGSDCWRQAREKTGDERTDVLVKLYEEQLKKIPAIVYARSFEIRDQNDRPLYHMVFGTTELRGLEVMKESMYDLDHRGLYRFSDLIGFGQKSILGYSNEPEWMDAAAKQMWRTFGAKPRPPVPLIALRNWTIQSTPYIFRKGTLRALEALGGVAEVVGRKRRGTFPEGCSVRFNGWPGP